MSSAASQERIRAAHAPCNYLPLDVVLLVIESLRPDRHNAILPPSHVIAKTLLNVRLVSRACNEVAVRLLHRHCMYISRNDKAVELAKAIISDSRCHVRSLFSDFFNIRNMFLAPLQNLGGARNNSSLAAFVERNSLDMASDSPTNSGDVNFLNEYSDYEDGHLSDLSDSDSESGQVYSADGDGSGPTVEALNCVETAKAVRVILIAVSPWLLNLVIDIPLRNLRPEYDILRVRPILRQGFKALENLIEFSSINDELYLSLRSPSWQDPPVWATCWPKLRRLQLYNIDVDTETGLWKHMTHLPELEKVVFARADPGELHLFDFKQAWLQAVQASGVASGEIEKDLKRDISIILMNLSEEQPNFELFRESWQTLDPEGHVRVLLADVPCEGSDRDDAPDLTQNYLRRLNLAGEVWDEDVLGAHIAPNNG